MKKVSLILILTLIITPKLIGQNKKFDYKNLKPENFKNAQVKDGAVFNDKDGNTFKIKNTEGLKGLRLKQDGKWLKHGAFFSFYNGRLTSMTTYHYGKKHGPYEKYHANGKVQFEYSHKNNLREGNWRQYRDDGTIYEECTYKNGKIEGVKITYHTNEKKKFVNNYINGIRNGESLYYNDEGKLVSKSNYKMGKKVGKTQWY